MKIIYIKWEIDFNNNKTKDLPLDYYVIFIKTNNFSIHNCDSSLPIFSCKTDKGTLSVKKSIITFFGKSKLIEIKINKTIKEIYLPNLSINKIVKEKEINLQLKIEKQLSLLYDNVIKEFRTPLWNIDISYKHNNIVYLLELKKWKLKLEDVNQLIRYSEHFNELGIEVNLSLIWKEYSKAISNYAMSKNVYVFTYKKYYDKIKKHI